MSDNEGLDRVDQGTIFMFSLVFMLAGATLLWFACNWYRKRAKMKRARSKESKAIKTKVKQTFSRFSQVDEELTMHHMDEDDEAILQASVGHNLNGGQSTATRHQPVTPSQAAPLDVTSDTHPAPVPYLETDL